MDLDIRQHLAKAKENQDSGALDSAYLLIKDSTAPEVSGQTKVSGKNPNVASELYVVCAETALQLGGVEISAECLKMYFEGNPPANLFTCRAFLCQGQLKSPPATGSVEEFKEAEKSFLKAMEISKKEPRYHFMVFNASVLYLQAVRPLLHPGRCHHLIPSLKQMVQSLEEVADQDHSWRAELMIHLVKCLVDSGQVEEAASFAKVTEDFIKTHTPQLYPEVYTLLVKHKLSEDNVLLETSSESTTLAFIYKMQMLKKWIDVDVNMLTKEDLEKLEEIFPLLVDCPKATATPVNSIHPQSPTRLLLSNRVAFLLELALLSLQVKHQKVASDCLKELKSAGEANVDQLIIMECVNCEINLLKKEVKINDYSKASIEAHLKEIDNLDQLLQTAVKEASPQAVQAVCATQWNFCLPLLQHRLRKYIKKSLLNMAQALENMQSMLLEMRCQVHSELAIIEEEEGCLEASLTHLQKAMLLDNGTQRERLSSAFQLLRLRSALRETPSRPEDKAALLMQQARDMLPQSSTDSRPILVSVGLLLAPGDFQMVLDADNTSKISTEALGTEPPVQLAAKAHHHITCVQRVGGHLARQNKDKDGAERAKLWATLAKTARKQEVWDVCRAACRFCLLYDDGRWKVSRTDKYNCSRKEKKETGPECLHSCSGTQTHVMMWRLLAEICFINAEATIQKLLTEGVKLNCSAVPSQERWMGFSEEDQNWVVYRDWIQALSAYATSNFLRAAELGAEIREQWVVTNAAVYLWNYNHHLLAAGEYQLLLPTFQSLVGMLQATEDNGNPTLCVLLCDAVARGLIQPLPVEQSAELPPAGAQARDRAEKETPRPARVLGISQLSSALQRFQKALKMCEFALNIFCCKITRETVPVAAKQRVLSTWVLIKRHLQQPIDSNMGWLKDKCENEEVFAMMCVLVRVEMLQCNMNPKQMELSAPSVSALVSMASECSWSDAVVELQVWCQLAAFCYRVKDHSLVLYCTQTALQLEEGAEKSLKIQPYVLFEQTAVSEMLSNSACLRGLSLVCESSGALDIYREALNVLRSSVSFAEKADNQELCVTAAGHFWNTCLPLIQNPEERWQLREHLENILTALAHTAKHGKKQSKGKGSLALLAMSSGNSQHGATNDDKDLTLRASIYRLLADIHTDKADYRSALLLLSKAIRDMPHTEHRLPLITDCIYLKAHLGESIELDMQELRHKGEQYCSLVWHQAALYTSNMNLQLNCYQKAITSLMSAETQMCKVSILLEFGRWLHFHNFPKEVSQQQIQWAVDILLHLEPTEAKESENVSDFTTEKCESSLGVQGSFTENVTSLKEVCRLDLLIQAHTLLAVMSDRTSQEHRLNLLRAHAFVLQMWQASMTVAREISDEMTKNQPPQTPLSTGKGKSKKRKNVKSATPEEDKPAVLDTTPSNLKDWAEYVCPDQVRQIFRTNSNPCCINKHSITNQTQSLFHLNLLEKELHSLSLNHLTLPILHLAETIAHDLLERRSLSDLYRLKIVRTCVQLGLETCSSCQEKLLNLSRIQEEEQMACHKAIVVSQMRRSLHKVYRQKTNLNDQKWIWRLRKDVSSQDIWLEKAEVCLSLGLYQSAQQLLAEAHMVATELGDKEARSKSLLSLARLACEEQNHSQALILLEKAQTLGGDAEFWYQYTLIKVTAVAGQRDQDSQTKVDIIIKRGCEALLQVQEQEVNRVQELAYMITSLNKRGAVECIRAISAKATETLSTEAVQRLTAACDSLSNCASGFTKLSLRGQAVEAHLECSHGLRLLATHFADGEEKRRFLLDGLSQMQLAVTLQERVAFDAQSLLPLQQNLDLSLAAMRRLLHLRLCLAGCSLDLLEEHCAEETCQALIHSKKTPVEVALLEYTSSTPEPSSTEQEWASVVRTSGQMVLSQLAAVSSQSLDNMEIKACCLSLMGKYLRLIAVQEEPMYVKTLWDRSKQEARLDSESFPTLKENSEEDSDSSRNKPNTTPDRSADLQKRLKVQQLLAEASKTLSEAVNQCLQHNLPSTILADASLNMLECHGLSDLAVAGQYLALFQSCCTVITMEEVLSSACTDTSASQLSALLSIRRNFLLSQEERPSSMLKGVEDYLSSSKAFSHLTINPNHLNILSEISPNHKILLLQHSKDGSELYGGVYKTTTEAENLKGKTAQVPGTVTSSRVAKVSVCPQALQALREQIQIFDQKTRQSYLKKDSWKCTGAPSEASEEHQKTAEDTTLMLHFREIVKDMEAYLNPLLSQFDLSWLRPNTEPLPIPEMTKTKEKKVISDKVEQDEYVVLLADRKLLELPLESLSFLQGLGSVARDFSLQLFYSRLWRDEQHKVEGSNKKKTKGGKGTKGKEDQSQTIKEVPAKAVVPSYALAVDSRNFKYIINPCDEGHFGGTNLSMTMKEVMKTNSQPYTRLWESFPGSKERLSLSEKEQMLYRCSGFVYLGMDPFLANIPPAKLAAFDLSGCHLALLFDRFQKTKALHQANLKRPNSAGQLGVEKPLDVALLLSLSGVKSIILNQWHSSLLQNAHDVAAVLNNLMTLRLTSGQTIQALRGDDSNQPLHNSEPNGALHSAHDQVLFTDSKEKAQSEPGLTPSAFNCILYGLPNLIIT